jgi:hypothetical protein
MTVLIVDLFTFTDRPTWLDAFFTGYVFPRKKKKLGKI